MLPGDLGEAESAFSIAEYRGTIDVERRPSDPPAFESGAPHAGAHSFDDQVPFKLGNGADDHHDCSTERSTCVQRLTEANELDLQVIQLIEHIEEVLH